MLKSAGSALTKLPAANALYVADGVTQELGAANVGVAVRTAEGVRCRRTARRLTARPTKPPPPHTPVH